MANLRVYDFTTGIETGVQPDAGTPTDPNDLVTFGFVGTRKAEVPSGTINNVNVTFTLTSAPLNAASFQLYQNGLLLRLTTHYTRSGVTITMITAPNFAETLDAVYSF